MTMSFVSVDSKQIMQKEKKKGVARLTENWAQLSGTLHEVGFIISKITTKQTKHSNWTKPDNLMCLWEFFLILFCKTAKPVGVAAAPVRCVTLRIAGDSAT